MEKVPSALREAINVPVPTDVCLVATVLPDGFAQVTPRGSAMVFDDEHFALWERGKGSTNANLADGAKVTIYYQNSQLRKDGVLPLAGIARFYGTAELHKSGPVFDEVWERLIEYEKGRDPEKKGFAVLIAIKRAEDLSGEALETD